MPAVAARLMPQTLEAWERYVLWADKQVEREVTGQEGFLLQDYLPSNDRDTIRRQIRTGNVVVQKRTGIVPAGTSFAVPDGSIHHWWGTTYIRGVSLEQVLKLVKDYDHHAGRFVEVERSRLIAHEGDTYRFFLRLKRAKVPITVYYNTEHESRYHVRNGKQVWVRNVATRIAELENAGTATERELTDQEDWGFLWRVRTWWRFSESDNGVTVEVESASLGRGVPGWLKLVPGLMQYIDSVPRESIVNTLTTVRTYSGRS